jgi:hypothetical protein
MPVLPQQIVHDFIDTLASIEPVDLIFDMRSWLEEHNPYLLGLIEYLRLHLQFNSPSLCVGCTIIRYVLLKQNTQNEVSAMIEGRPPEHFVVCDEIIRYFIDELESNPSEFIEKVMNDFDLAQNTEFMDFCLKTSKREIQAVSEIVKKNLLSFQYQIFGYIPVMCVYVLYLKMFGYQPLPHLFERHPVP